MTVIIIPHIKCSHFKEVVHFLANIKSFFPNQSHRGFYSTFLSNPKFSLDLFLLSSNAFDVFAFLLDFFLAAKKLQLTFHLKFKTEKFFSAFPDETKLCANCCLKVHSMIKQQYTFIKNKSAQNWLLCICQQMYSRYNNCLKKLKNIGLYCRNTLHS